MASSRLLSELDFSGLSFFTASVDGSGRVGALLLLLLGCFGSRTMAGEAEPAGFTSAGGGPVGRGLGGRGEDLCELPAARSSFAPAKPTRFGDVGDAAVPSFMALLLIGRIGSTALSVFSSGRGEGRRPLLVLADASWPPLVGPERGDTAGGGFRKGGVPMGGVPLGGVAEVGTGGGALVGGDVALRGEPAPSALNALHFSPVAAGCSCCSCAFALLCGEGGATSGVALGARCMSRAPPKVSFGRSLHVTQ